MAETKPTDSAPEAMEVEDTKMETIETTKTETSKPSKTEASEPSKTEASEPSKTEASEPSKTEASDPSKTEASEPSKTETSKPSKTETSEPSKTETSEPSKTETSEPSKTETSEPSKTETSEPSKTETSEPSKTETSEPSKTETSEPSKTETTESSKTDTTEPSKTKTSKPSKTETTEPPKTETTEPSKTETTGPSKTDTSEPSKTETSKPVKTETTEPSKTDTSEPSKTDTSEPSKTETSEPSKTETSEPLKTETTEASKAESTEAQKMDTTESPVKTTPETVTESSEKGKVEESNGTQNGHTEENKASVEAAVDPELNSKIVKQIEYYFGNYNLPRDKFLSAEVKKDDGWVPMSIMLKFARLAKLSSDSAVIAAAIKDANGFMEVDESSSKIRRSTTEPLPEMTEGLQEESVKRTIYCKGFPKDGSITLDVLLEYFKKFGEFDSVRIRNYVDRNSSVQGFKGSVLVVFKTVEIAQKFLDAPPVQYKKTYLIRKWFADYLGEKKQEMEERLARKQARQDKSESNGQTKQVEFEELPRGNFLRATGFKNNTMREDIKAAVFDLTNDCAFVDFRKGEETAYIRFSEADSNKEILKALEGNLTVNGSAISLFLVEGEEEEQQLQKANEARRKSHSAGPYPKKRKMGGGGYGGRGRGGRNKRQRNN